MTQPRVSSTARTGCATRWFLVTLAALSLGPIGCSKPPSPPAPAAQHTATSPGAKAITAADRPPSALVDVGESAEALFDAAHSSDWRGALERLRDLDAAAAALPMDLPKRDLVAQLRSRVQDIRQSVTAHDRVNTMDYANGVTRIVADLSGEFQTTVPVEVVLLDYYGRQLELGIAAGRQSTLAQATTDVRSTWNRIERTILERGHVDEARRFTDIVVQLEGARRPDDFVAPTRAELAAVDGLERIFTASK